MSIEMKQPSTLSMIVYNRHVTGYNRHVTGLTIFVIPPLTSVMDSLIDFVRFEYNVCFVWICYMCYLK